MFEKIRNALKKGLTTTGNVRMSPEAKQLAAAALLVEAAGRDRDFTDGEREAIKRAITEHFTLNADEAADLLKLAEERAKVGMGEYIFAKAVQEGFNQEERGQVVEMLWEVALSDGTLHRMETVMIGTLAREVGLSAGECASAKERAAARLGH